MIFILIRKIAAPVALIVAWLGITSFAFVKFNASENLKVEYEKKLALKVNEVLDEAEKKVIDEQEILEDDSSIVVEVLEEDVDRNIEQSDLTRGNLTSRGGSRTEREVNVIYYEELGLNIADNEIEMLERIVQAEAGGSGYDGMLAVANVVLNRVKYERFPDTVTEVVFANRQFTPVSDGRYYTVTVSETAKQVVQDALSGARILDEDALYFCTPTAPGKGWFETDLRKITYIAPHNFYGYK